MRRKQRTAIYELSLALKLTQEYIGDDLLPRLPGWSWFDALTKHAPELLPNTLLNCWSNHRHPEYDGGTTVGITEASK